MRIEKSRVCSAETALYIELPLFLFLCHMMEIVHVHVNTITYIEHYYRMGKKKDIGKKKSIAKKNEIGKKNKR